MYKVIKFFTDLQDFKHPYNVGDEFPREGLKVSEDRLRELSTRNNRRKEPLIKKVEEEPKEPEEKKYTKTDINRLSKAELVTLASEVGINNADELSGADLKEQLIAYFNL